MNVTLTIDMDSKCAECGQPGATPSGICMACAAVAMTSGAVMKSDKGKAVQSRYVHMVASARNRIQILNEDDGK